MHFVATSVTEMLYVTDTPLTLLQMEAISVAALVIPVSQNAMTVCLQAKIPLLAQTCVHQSHRQKLHLQQKWSLPQQCFYNDTSTKNDVHKNNNTKDNDEAYNDIDSYDNNDTSDNNGGYDDTFDRNDNYKGAYVSNGDN